MELWRDGGVEGWSGAGRAGWAALLGAQASPMLSDVFSCPSSSANLLPETSPPTGPGAQHRQAQGSPAPWLFVQSLGRRPSATAQRPEL